jgi:hypothetical protein
MIEDASEVLLKPLKAAGIIGVYKISMARRGRNLELFVDVSLPEGH